MSDALPPSVLRVPFAVRAADLDSRGLCGLRAMCDLMQEAAGEHASRLGAGPEAFGELGLAWVLVSWRLAVVRLPAWRERLTVETWPSARTERTADRDFLVSDASGSAVARAASTWMTLDVARRRPARLPEVVRSIPLPGRERVLPPDGGKPAPPDPVSSAVEIRALRADVDPNGHVRNTVYLDWVVESVPIEVVSASGLAGLELSFRAECRGGTSVRAECGPDGGPAGPRSFRHRVVEAATGRELVLGRSRWEAPAGPPAR